MLDAVTNEVLGLSPREQQKTIFSNMLDAFDQGYCAMMEADTGVGKSLATLAAAADWLSKNNGRFLIAVPTKALAAQLLEESKKIALLSKVSTVIYAKSDFVSHSLLSLFINQVDEQIAERVQTWIQTQIALSKTSSTAWLVEDLIDFVPEFGFVSLCTLDELEDDDDDAWLTYKSQFDKESSSRLVICTHAMLAYDVIVRRKKDQRIAQKNNDGLFNFSEERGPASSKLTKKQLINQGIIESLDGNNNSHLPPYDVVVVDEAHLFEATVAQALSLKCGFWVIESALKHLKSKAGEPKLNAALADVRNVFGQIYKALGNDGMLEISLSKLISNHRKLASDALLVLGNLMESMNEFSVSSKQQKTSSYARYNRQKYALSAFLETVEYNPGVISFSPEKKYASVHAASKKPDYILDYLYRTTKSVIALSATLTIPRNGSDDYEIMANNLYFPKNERRKFYAPVRSGFLTRGVALECVADSAFLPINNTGQSDYVDQLSAWSKGVAKKIESDYHQGIGGMLVLNTSYASISSITKEIDSGIPCIVAKPDYPLSRQKADFISLAKKGLRPIWFGIGGAWTGLDVSGKDIGVSAEFDNVLTNLVITRLPIGLNRSTFVYASGSSFNIFKESFESYLIFKQGLGRLVRRDGLPKNRKITILDPRVSGGASNFLFKTLASALIPYEERAKKVNPLARKKVVVS